MKNTLRRTLAMLLILAALLPILSMASYAAVATKSYSLGQTVTVTKDGAWYKFSVPSSGYLTITSNAKVTWKLGKSTSDTTDYRVTTTKSAEPVSKGTYYMKAKGVNGNVKIKLTLTAVSQPANYTASRAVALSANAKTYVMQTKLDNYNHWYKIKLTEKRKFSIVGLMGDVDSYSYRIMDSNLKPVDTSYNATKNILTTSNAMAKGTYYVQVHSASQSDLNDIATGAILNRFYWK